MADGDIVERLKHGRNGARNCAEAADEITSLRGELAMCRRIGDSLINEANRLRSELAEAREKALEEAATVAEKAVADLIVSVRNVIDLRGTPANFVSRRIRALKTKKPAVRDHRAAGVENGSVEA